MSDYDSGDELLAGVDVDNLMTGSKRSRSSSQDDSSKRTKLERQEDHDHGNIATTILRDSFGYRDFRLEQFSAIASTLRGENVLVVFPTGAGKSLCYQIPGVAFEKIDAKHGDRAHVGPGISIVVSPLIALMKDQVDALQRKGIPAACLDSTKTYEQQQQTSAAMREGKLRFLYCAPERLNNEGFVESMKYVPGGIRLVAVDEAHCISEWGHSFRPDYLKVARFVQEIKAERVICLTATATPRVADDVAKAFKIEKSNVFRTSPYRPNLQLLAESMKSKQDKYPRLFKFLTEHEGSTLVYVTLQKQAEMLASKLNAQGFDAAAFHAGLKTEEKTQIQDDFMAGKVLIVVATIAFGMGIDKADIRNILHFDLSGTVEEYSQQIGRAGRDGKTSHCMFYICPEDFYLRENFARGDLPSRKSLHGLLTDVFGREVVDIPGGKAIKLNQISLSREYDMRASPLSILLATLELRFGLIRAITPEYSSYQFEPKYEYDRSARNDKSQEAKSIFENAEKVKKWYKIDANAVAKSTGLLRADLIRKLNDFHDRGFIMLRASGVENRYKILEKLPSTREEIDAVVDKLYAEMEAREEDALRRTQQVANLITGDQCFALSLAEHFGMGLPAGKTKCGHCTHCLTGKPVKLPPKPTPPVDIVGIQKILAACDVRDDPRFLARVAFGIKSPRVTQLKLDKKQIFGSLEDHDFKSLLEEFTKACDDATCESKSKSKRR
ncbi:ATP-dependent DNA helicase recQ [Xylariaceae sp. FL0662B]|nr:ATP-dependent DNA helicase recQ [Xylariaceae sp. FL0662B]